MKVTNRDVFESRTAIQELVGYDLPIRTSYQVATLTRKINEVLKDIDVSRRNLIQKYGTDAERGGKEVKTDNANYDNFMSEFNELLDIEIEIIVAKIMFPEKITTTCDKCGHNANTPLTIKPWILAALNNFIEVT